MAENPRNRSGLKKHRGRWVKSEKDVYGIRKMGKELEK
jgi:hypothetical protein